MILYLCHSVGKLPISINPCIRLGDAAKFIRCCHLLSSPSAKSVSLVMEMGVRKNNDLRLLLLLLRCRTNARLISSRKRSPQVRQHRRSSDCYRTSTGQGHEPYSTRLLSVSPVSWQTQPSNASTCSIASMPLSLRIGRHMQRSLCGDQVRISQRTLTNVGAIEWP